MPEYTLAVYGDDDTTPLFSVGTDPSHANPYLQTPNDYGEAEIDLQQGRAMIGQVNLSVIDPQNGPTQADRFLTALLGTPGGFSALNGRRAVFAQASPSAVILDGVVAGVRLNPSFAGFTLELRDIRERGRKVRVFTQTDTCCVMPRGVLNGYGAPFDGAPVSQWIAPPVEPVTAVFRQSILAGSYFSLHEHWSGQGREDDEVDPRVVLSGAAIEALRPMESRTQSGATVYRYRVQVGWRANSGDTWKWLKPFARRLVLVLPARLNGNPVQAAWRIDDPGDIFGSYPSDGQTVQLVIRYVGPPTEAFPFHYEGTWGEFTRNLLRGDYCTEIDPTSIIGSQRIDPRIRYDSAALLAIETPIRVRVTEPRDDLREVLEELCRPIGAAPALNPAGQVSPILYAIPPVSAVLPELNDGNTRPLAGWEHPTSNAITTVEVNYQRDFRVPVEEDPDGARSACDGVSSRDVTVVHRAPDGVLDLMGEKPLKVDAWMFRAIGGTEGEPVSGDVADETAAQLAQERTYQCIDRFAYGGLVSFCEVRADVLADAREGDWVLDARSWRPNYLSGKRGGNHLAQIVSMRRLSPAWVGVRLIDAAPSDHPVGQPTLGTITADDEGFVAVPITAIPAGAEARVDYAVSDTLPPVTSGKWVFLGRTSATGVLTSPRLPSGATVWIRARGEAVGRRPSAWTNAVSVEIPIVARILFASVYVDDDGKATVRWAANQRTAGVRIHYQVHSATVDPETLPNSVDVVASAGEKMLDIGVREDEAVTAELEPWTGWTGTAVAGEAGERYRISSIGTLPPGSLDLIYRGSDGGIRHYEVVTHNAPSEVETWVYWKIFDSPIDEDWLEELIQPANRHTVLDDGGSGEFTTAQPPAGTILKGIVVAMRPTDDGYTVVGDGVEFEADGSEAPIHVGEPKFVENPAGTHSTFSVTIGDPRGVVTGVDVFLSVGASASGPHAATKSGDAYSYQFALDHDHVTIVRARINRDDGGEPIWLGPYTADTDKIPDIPDVAITWVADDAYVQVDCEDTDAVSLWRQKVVDGVPGTEVQIPARGADPRFGSFTEAHVTEEVRYRVYAKNAAGTAGEYRDVRIVPPQLAQFLATHARITDATATTITVTVDADPDTAEVELLDDTTATRTSGPNVGVKSPSGTVWVFARPAAGSGPRMAWFRSTLADHVSDDDGVVIPEIGQGVVPLIVRARVTASSSNSMTVQVRVADPTPQNNITLSYVAQDVVGINPGSPQTILAANVTSNLDTTGFVSFAVPRPPVGASDGSISFTATSTGRIADVDSVTIPAQVPPVMRVDTAEDQAHPSGPRGIVTLSPLPGAVYDSVQFASQAGNANPSSWGSGNLGALSHYVPLHSKHASAIGYRVQRSGVVVQQDWVRGFDVGEVAEVLTIDVRESGTGTVAIVFECDTDTAIGSGNVRFRLDGGPTYTALTVNAQRLASTLEIGGISQSTMGAREIAVQARNKHGAWGPEKIGSIPVYVEAAAPTGVITSATVLQKHAGLCASPPLPSVGVTNTITWTVSGTPAPGTRLNVECWVDGEYYDTPADNLLFASGSIDHEVEGYRTGPGSVSQRVQYRVRTTNPTNIAAVWTNTINQGWVAC